MLMQEELKSSTFKYIENEIYSYHETLRHIELLEYELMNRSTTDDENIGAGKNSVRNTSSETERKATALLTDKRIVRLQQKVNAVEKVYNQLLPEKKEVIKLYYWDKPGELTWEGIAKETNTSRATALRWRKQFVEDVARELGEI